MSDTSQPEEPPSLVLPIVGDDDPVARLIVWTQRLILKHPAAAQAAFRALVSEGRQFAATPEGEAWRTRLEASEALRRLRPLWETATLNVLEATTTAALPGQFIELVAQSLSRADLEEITAGIAEVRSMERERSEP